MISEDEFKDSYLSKLTWNQLVEQAINVILDFEHSELSRKKSIEY
jgi:hypothetical protein